MRARGSRIRNFLLIARIRQRDRIPPIVNLTSEINPPEKQEPAYFTVTEVMEKRRHDRNMLNSPKRACREVGSTILEYITCFYLLRQSMQTLQKEKYHFPAAS
jgi:hypothetical protein